MTTVLWQRVEGGLVFAACVAWLLVVGPDWPAWLWVLVALFPDVSFAGYLMGNRVGAAVYNLAHLYAGGVLVALSSVALGPEFLFAGVVWIAHCGFDRALGYGLKEVTGFTDTHLGEIGKAKL